MSLGTPLPPDAFGELQLREVLDAIPARVAILDRERRHRYVNREYAGFVGWPPEQILGRTVDEVLGAEAYARLQHLGERALAGETVRWDGWIPYAEGGSRYVERVYMPHRGGDGAIDGYFVFARDLTALKQSERQLATKLNLLGESEALAAAITNSALDSVVVIDDAGIVISFNAAAERTFGYTCAQAVGQPIGDLIVPPALRARHAAGFARYLATGEAHVLGRRVELEGMRADGSCFPVELAINEVSLPGRRLFTAYLRDLTDARLATAEMQRQREALHQSEKMAAFGSLLAGVAHELNNPLSIVLGNALMLEEEAREAGAASLGERAGTIQVAAERCARIVRAFLAMARQRKARLQPVHVRTLVEDALALLAYGLRADGIDIAVQIADDTPQVLGDPDQLNQVLANLLVNARQALESHPPPRRIRISTGVEGHSVAVSILDSGPGIQGAIRSRIFDPFFTTKPVGAGTGIGLSVSRGIAETHGGSLTLSDHSGEGGAHFVLRLPCVSGVCAPEAVPMPLADGAGIGVALVVDDEPEVAAILVEMLGEQGYLCDIVASGREARAALNATDYDVVFCDLHMPDTDGPTFYAWIESQMAPLCRRVVFVTGDTLGATVADFLARVGRPVLEKPFTPADLRRVLAELAG